MLPCVVADGDESPFPVASVVRLSPQASDAKSAVLVARSMAYLMVRVLFHGAPVPGLKVEFGKIADEKDTAPEKMDPSLTTDEEGVALFPRLVVAGIYACNIERQPSTIVPTVTNIDAPHPVVLPVGRPVVDVGDVDEFAHRPAGEAGD